MNLETRNMFKRGGNGGVKWKERRITKRRSSDNQQSAERVNIEQSPLERQRFVLCDTGVHFSLDVLPS